MTDRIVVKGLQLRGRHGVLPEEAALGQRFEIDIDLELDLEPAARSDDLALGVSYAEVVQVATTAFGAQRFNLIEAAAGAVAQQLLATFPLVYAVTVELRKPAAPIEAIFENVGVVITRRRSDG